MMPLVIWVLLILLTILLNSCEHITIHDHIVAVNKGPLGCSYVHTLTNKTDAKGKVVVTKLDKATCEKMTLGWIMLEPDAYAELKQDIEQGCQYANGLCGYDFTVEETKFFSNMESAMGKPLTSSKASIPRLLRP